MADKSVSFTSIERMWLKKCIDLQVKSLVRSKSGEMPGSEVIRIRDEEIAVLRLLDSRL